MIVILTFLLFYIVKSQDYSWVLISNFNYNNPHKAILNVAYPASIAFYYITIVPPGSNYSFEGEFLKKDVYESSLTVYNSNGLTDPDFKSINTFLSDNKHKGEAKEREPWLLCLMVQPRKLEIKTRPEANR